MKLKISFSDLMKCRLAARLQPRTKHGTELLHGLYGGTEKLLNG